MIWLRRLIAVPLGFIFMWLLVGGLLSVHAQGTLLSPEFHKEQLERADIYNFILDDLPETAVNELREQYPVQTGAGPGEDGTTDVVLPVMLEEAPESLRAVVPSEWLQEQVEQVIDQLGGYLTGRQDEFHISVPLRDRAVALSQEIRTLLPYDTMYDHVMTELVRPGIDEALEDGNAAPFGAPVTTDEIAASLERAFPKDWVSGQADEALTEVTAYLVGDKDSMEVRIALDERSFAALEEVKTLLRKADDFQIVFDEVINPVLDENVPEVVYLPLDVTITREEVKQSFLDQVPLDWLREQAVAVVDDVGPYVAGETDTFEVVVPIDERKENAEAVIGSLARIKAEDVLSALPECEDSAASLLEVDRLRSGSLPECAPAGLTQETLDIQLKFLFDNIDLDALIRGFGYDIPERVVYTDEDLREALSDSGGEEALEILDGIREVFRDGWTYTDEDFKADLASDGGMSDPEALEDVRELLRDGWTFTDADLRQSLKESGGEDAVEQLDSARDTLGSDWLSPIRLFLLWAVLLLAIGFLGGRTWWSRLAWAAAVLSISAAVAIVAYSVVLGFAVPQLLESVREEALREAGTGPTAILLLEKVFSMAEAATESFLGDRVRSSSVMLLILGLATLLAALVMRRLTLR